MENINKTVKHIIADRLGVEERKVIETAKLSDDLGADSLDIIELVLVFEEEFGCDIPDEVMESFKTVQNIIDYLEENL